MNGSSSDPKTIMDQRAAEVLARAEELLRRSKELLARLDKLVDHDKEIEPATKANPTDLT